MLRPVLAFLTLSLAAFILAPTVSSVHERVESLGIDRKMPWEIWKWTDEPTPTMSPPGCDKKERHLESEITHWPKRIEKDQPFDIRGIVRSVEDGGVGVQDIEVDIFLNKTKSEPGIFLVKLHTTSGGAFGITTSLPIELQAAHYHIIAHAKEKLVSCTMYFEHWSDPETDVLSRTDIRFEPVEHAVLGREFVVRGRVVDAVGGPVQKANVVVTHNGKTFRYTTDDAGAFELPLRPSKAGIVDVSARYAGNRYYEASQNKTNVSVAEEEVVLANGATRLVLTRSTPSAVSGQVFVGENVTKGEMTLRFANLSVATCPTCPAAPRVSFPVGADGAWNATLVVPANATPGNYTFFLSGGGLKKEYAFNATLEVQPVLAIETRGGGLFARSYEARLNLTDEAGRPLAGIVSLSGPDGWRSNATDANGGLALAGAASCGAHPVSAHYNGSAGYRPASAAGDVRVCGFLGFVPPWLLAIPWWVWPLALLAGVGAWFAYRRLRQRYASTILTGPPLAIRFTEPMDDAAGYAAVGEAVVATAFLEEPLPDGHALRLGPVHEMASTPLDAELRAHLRILPDKLGELPIRAEIVDAAGRVVSRRTAVLRVVRYAEEIERRYLALRHERGVAESVTPREFERWLVSRSPGLDAGVTRRLVHVFEEADYGPRTASRADLAVYLVAERGVEEVKADALA